MKKAKQSSFGEGKKKREEGREKRREEGRKEGRNEGRKDGRKKKERNCNLLLF
jgi:flagellar biosynthesis/type III secretory pathway protein FliH